MNNWIEINLPWSVPVNLDGPDYPLDITKAAVVKKFGKTQIEIKEDFEIKHNKAFWMAQIELDDNIIRDDNPIADEIKALEKLLKEMDEFEFNLPEVEQWNEECDKINTQERDELEKNSFYPSELRRPGVLIEIKEEDGVTKKYLIGNINAQGGICDDCLGFSPSSIVLRAKVLIEDIS